MDEIDQFRSTLFWSFSDSPTILFVRFLSNNIHIFCFVEDSGSGVSQQNLKLSLSVIIAVVCGRLILHTNLFRHLFEEGRHMNLSDQ